MIDITARAELYCYYDRTDGCPDKHWRHEPLIIERDTRARLMAAIAALGWSIDEDEGIAICAACSAAGHTHAEAAVRSKAFNLAHDAVIMAIQPDRPRCSHGRAPAPQHARGAVEAGHVKRSALFPALVCWECGA